MKEGDKCPICKSGIVCKQDDLEFEDIDLTTNKKTIKKFPNGTLACDFCSWVNE
jgi:hypothetical protein